MLDVTLKHAKRVESTIALRHAQMAFLHTALPVEDQRCRDTGIEEWCDLVEA